MCVAQKGALRVRVEVQGKLAHGAIPQEGEDPIPPLAGFFDFVARTQAALQCKNGEHRFLSWTI